MPLGKTTFGSVEESSGTTIVMSSEDLAWFMSVYALGMLLGGLLSGALMNAVGRRGALLVSALPSLLGWLMTGSFYELALALGILLVMLGGAFTSWQQLALICTSPTLTYATLIFFCKESPAYLLMKGQESEARAAMQYYRGADYCIDKEMNDIKESQEEAKKAKFKLSDLKKTHIHRPIIITLTIGIFSQLSGIQVLTSNLNSIFKVVLKN
ncbi:sugar transporter ERD6-like 6 [Hyalella azteca]|uniref:Sugar transporter ERD6-like 6 n=1 Tax=Hyalella azteca TaxID=294128 RepID=A0A8B7NMP0_HYAAZ|nr:sugar transporter ERD6-like 6 [Hyalella azteca]